MDLENQDQAMLNRNQEEESLELLNQFESVSWREWKKTNWNIFCCKGAIMLGINAHLFLFTNACLIAVSIVFYVTVYVILP